MSGPANRAERLAWIDFAKGSAIALVVLYHAVIYLQGIGVAAQWDRLNNALDTLRMPLFFTMSGVLAARVVRLPFRELFDRRIRLLLYLYVLWTVVQWVFFSLLPPFTLENRRPSLDALYLMFVSPNANLWFIYALPLYLSAAHVIRNLRSWLQIALAAGVSALFGMGWMGLLTTPWGKTGRYFFFFIAAIHASSWIISVANRARWWHVLASAAGFAISTLVLTNVAIRRVPFTLIIGGLTAVALGITASVVLSRIPWMNWIRLLGAKTLPIYLVHTLPFAVVCAALLGVARSLPDWLGLIGPVLLAAIGILVALGVERVCRDVPGVLSLPRWLRPKLGTSSHTK